MASVLPIDIDVMLLLPEELKSLSLVRGRSLRQQASKSFLPSLLAQETTMKAYTSTSCVKNSTPVLGVCYCYICEFTGGSLHAFRALCRLALHLLQITGTLLSITETLLHVNQTGPVLQQSRCKFSPSSAKSRTAVQ